MNQARIYPLEAWQRALQRRAKREADARRQRYGNPYNRDRDDDRAGAA